MSTEFAARDSAAVRTQAITSLDDLTDLTVAELWELYRQGATPAPEDLDGRLVGRMLAVPGLDKPAVAETLRGFAASGLFPWQGKSFLSHGDGTGAGVNRVLGNRREWFRFSTFVGPSRAGDFDALHLNYDNPGNPAPIRAVKDEVREVADGIWLGLAYLRLPGARFHMALFFALSKQAEPHREAPADARRGFPLALAAVPVLGLILWLLARRRKRNDP